MFVQIAKIFVILLVHMYVISSVAENIGQLPHCVENTEHGLLIVSTLDGKVSTLNSSGSILWQVDTGGALLKSNIHNIELANNAEWIRLIPSLTGGLYKFNGKTIDAIPISADSLLKSSFFYSHDLIIAGGKEIKTYGIGLHSGHLFYTCSLLGCQNETNFDGEIDNVLIIERNMLTVRAHEPRTGNERWNFSVGHHNIKIPSVSCLHVDNTVVNFNVTAILPEGLLMATARAKLEDKNEILWKYKFDVPIVNVWLWNGRHLSVVDVFDVPVAQDTKVAAAASISPAIYLAMHNKQLYIHESTKMLDIIQSNVYPNSVDAAAAVPNSKSVAKIPWKPIPASSSAIIKSGEQDATALSVLYNSEYVNGNGYYLFADIDSDNKGDFMCSDNRTRRNSGNDTKHDDAAATASIVISLQNNWYWAYAVLLLITAMTAYLVYDPKAIVLRIQKEKGQEEEKQPPLLIQSFPSFHPDIPNHVEKTFVSNYESTFETIGCLGRGGFGVVFKAKQKVDECSYAIKRITLPDSNATDHVLREVKALANLDHRNIVRYYNSWFEKPPVGWKYQCDKKYADSESDEDDHDGGDSEEEMQASSYSKLNHKRNNSTIIDMSIISGPVRPDNSTSDFDISFRDTTAETCSTRSAAVPNQSNSAAKGEEDPRKDSGGSEQLSIRRKRRNNSAGKIYLYIQMQLCKPDSLQDWLFNNNSCRSKSAIIPIFRQILNAVQYIHSKGLIHRDLKPNNIFFSMEDDVKVGDFGLVATTNDNVEDWNGGNAVTLLQSHTKGAGTQLYMSPEQLEKKRYNLKVDIYSLGVILFELLVPFKTEMERRETLTNLRKHIYPKEFQQSFPDEYRLLEKMLSHNPDVRPLTTQIKKTSPFTPTC